MSSARVLYAVRREVRRRFRRFSRSHVCIRLQADAGTSCECDAAGVYGQRFGRRVRSARCPAGGRCRGGGDHLGGSADLEARGAHQPDAQGDLPDPASGSRHRGWRARRLLFRARSGGSIEATWTRWVEAVHRRAARTREARRSQGERAFSTHDRNRERYVQRELGEWQAQAALRTGYALLGASSRARRVRTSSKLTGPAATVAAAKKSFYELLDSIKPG